MKCGFSRPHITKLTSMRKQKKRVAVGVWKRFETYHFGIAPSLAGASHKFQYRGLEVEVRLPRKPKQRDWRNEESPITCSEYMERNSRRVPLIYSVHCVDTYLATRKIRRIREDAIGAVKVSLFTKRERERLDRMAYDCSQILEEAFQYWVDVLRWKSGIPTLCHYAYNRQRSAWGTYLIDGDDRKRFYAPPHVIRVVTTTPVSRRAWSATQRAIARNAIVPLWHTSLAEASQRLQLGDTRGFVIELAIASETVVRRLMLRFLSSPTNSAVQSMVNHVQISRILDDWYRLGFNSANWHRLKAEKALVRRVMELRNAIMHRGDSPKLDGGTARDLMTSVARFVRHAELELKPPS
jgi:hypothetical protein